MVLMLTTPPKAKADLRTGSPRRKATQAASTTAYMGVLVLLLTLDQMKLAGMPLSRAKDQIILHQPCWVSSGAESA